jgi:hypothetical protein
MSEPRAATPAAPPAPTSAGNASRDAVAGGEAYVVGVNDEDGAAAANAEPFLPGSLASASGGGSGEDLRQALLRRVESGAAFPLRVRVLEVGADTLTQPLLKPTVFAPDAIAAAYQQYPWKMKSEGRMLRLKCEVALRRALRMECPSVVAERAAAGDVALPAEEEPEPEADGSDGGSDSEPSVDNIPTAKVLLVLCACACVSVGSSSLTHHLPANLYLSLVPRYGHVGAAAGEEGLGRGEGHQELGRGAAQGGAEAAAGGGGGRAAACQGAC